MPKKDERVQKTLITTSYPNRGDLMRKLGIPKRRAQRILTLVGIPKKNWPRKWVEDANSIGNGAGGWG